MRMPKDHRLIAGFSRIELDLELGEIMQDEELASFELDDLAIGELLGHAARSMLPRTATTGAMAPSSSKISSLPTSPA